MISDITGSVEIDGHIFSNDEIIGPAASPGMKYRHYVPRAPLTAVTGPGGLSAEYIKKHIAPGDAVICFNEYANMFAADMRHLLGHEHAFDEQARNLFAVLRAADGSSPARIWIQCPEAEGLGLAIANRIMRAAGVVHNAQRTMRN